VPDRRIVVELIIILFCLLFVTLTFYRSFELITHCSVIAVALSLFLMKLLSGGDCLNEGETSATVPEPLVLAAQLRSILTQLQSNFITSEGFCLQFFFFFFSFFYV
jgi:hypothetical protein